MAGWRAAARGVKKLLYPWSRASAMHRILLSLTACLLAPPALAQPQSGEPLPTGQRLTPSAAPGARFTPLIAGIGPMPQVAVDGAAAMVASPRGDEMLVLTSGFNRFNGADGKVNLAQSGQYIFRFRIGPGGARRLQTLSVPNSYGGIAWLPDGSGFVVGGGVDDVVHVFRRAGKSAAAPFVAAGQVPLGHAAGNGVDVRPQAAGVAVSPDGRRALVANYYSDSVSLIDLTMLTVLAEQDLRPGKIDPAASGTPGGENPFAVVWTYATHAFVSAPRDREIVALDIGERAVKVTARIHTLGEPTALLAAPARHLLFATEDNDDRLAILDTGAARLTAEPRLRLPESLGAVPVGKGLNPDNLALLPDGHLLVTLGGINALALVAPGGDGAIVEGLVPTGWYPSAVAADRSGARIFVANRKSPPGANPLGCAPQLATIKAQANACGAANQYIFQLEKAGLLDFPLPQGKVLAQTSLQVAANIGLDGAARRAEAERRVATLRPTIRHVVFIIKENRTYDQVLGDLDIGNGDPHLAILGQALSPNHHRLARGFVTLDNFYASGEQSSTGWTWSTAARTTDLLEKTAPVNYAQRGLAYEAEEQDRNIAAQQAAAERRATNPATPADADLLPGPALLTAPDPDDDDRPGQGFLWDAAIRAGLSVRNYGFADASVYETGKPGDKPVLRDPFNTATPIFASADRLLASRSDPYFRGFDQRLPDFWRVREWAREFDAMDAAGTVPTLTLLRLSHDHFGDFNQAIDGVNTVETEMADNDFALGLVVEKIAASHVAGSTLVFVIEDDAQNGADHVDARRSPAFVVGPLVRQGALVSTRYTTLNVLRTIEVLLGIAPLGLNDALALPMADLFDPAQQGWSYHAVAAPILRQTELPIATDRFAALAAAPCQSHDAAWWSVAMRGQDFRSEDRLDTPAFNHALWTGLGTGPEPAIRNGADLRVDRSRLLAGVTAPCANSKAQ